MSERKIILASQSPRRRELLKMICPDFQIQVSQEEEIMEGNEPAEITKNLASQKARAVASEYKEKGKVLIIGADTVVAVDGKILGKPKDKKEAKAMMEALSARSHEVFTGVSLLYVEDGKIQEEKSFAEKTQVMVAALSEEEIKAYIDTEEPYDKAGGYGIQGLFGKHIEGICGDYNNVVGLPVHRIYEEMKA